VLLQVLEKFWDPVNSGPDEYLVNCCFHEDSKPSLSVNVAKKLFKCHACDEKGSIPKLLSKVSGYTEDIVRYELNWLATLKWKLPEFNPRPFQDKLMKHDELLKHLTEERHWSLETIAELSLGWDGTRITIPVYNIFGDIVNVRKYKPKAEPDEYKVINIKGYGKGRLYGLQFMRSRSSRVVVLEGEPDCICAHSLGISAISGTSGSKHFNADWGRLFRTDKVTVCYDGDEAGEIGAARVAQVLLQSKIEVKVLTLEAGQDFTDFITSGKTRGDFEQLEVLAPLATIQTAISNESPDDGEIHDLSLSESSQQEYYKKTVRLRVMISGKTLSPYIVPKRVEVACNLPDLAMCKGCDLNFHGGKQEINFHDRCEELLQLVETDVSNHNKIFKEMAGIPSRCKIVKITTLEAQNIEEAKVIPNLDFSSDDSQYVMRQIFFIGHGLVANVAYEIVGLTLPHPRTQQVTYLTKSAVPLEDTISAFKVDDEMIQRLRVFSNEDTGEA